MRPAIEQVEEMEATVVEERHAVAHTGVVAGRRPIGGERLRWHLGRFRPAGQERDLRIAQQPRPDAATLDRDPANIIPAQPADQIRSGRHRPRRPFLIDQDTIDEQLDMDGVRAHHHIDDRISDLPFKHQRSRTEIRQQAETESGDAVHTHHLKQVEGRTISRRHGHRPSHRPSQIGNHQA